MTINDNSRYNMSVLKPGDIIFTFNKDNLISKIIARLTRWRGDSEEKKTKNISHVLIYFGDNLTIESKENGVVILPIRYYTKKKYSVSVKRYISASGEWPVQTLKLYCTGKVNKVHYAFLQLVALLFKKIFKLKTVGDVDKRNMDCAEFAVSSFRIIGIDLVPGMNPAEVSPMKLFNSQLLQDVNIE